MWFGINGQKYEINPSGILLSLLFGGNVLWMESNIVNNANHGVLGLLVILYVNMQLVRSSSTVKHIQKYITRNGQVKNTGFISEHTQMKDHVIITQLAAIGLSDHHHP